MAQTLEKLWAGLWVGLVAYLLIIAGTIFLSTKLLPFVAVNSIELAQPYLDSSPPKISLIEQRKIDSALAVPPSHHQERAHVVTIEVPSAGPANVAAQLDLAEKEGSTTALPETNAVVAISESSSIASVVTKSRVARSHSKHQLITASDIFNRSFGVITVATNSGSGL